MKKDSVVILYSGGADSRLMVEIALNMKKNIKCVLINYEQLHIEELDSAKKFLETENIEYQIVQLNGLNINSGLTGNGIKGQYEGVNEWHVPSRNLMFVSIAASIAEANDISEVWHGADFSDRENLFPDCYQEWFIKLNTLLEINGCSKVKVIAPLLGFTKEMVISLLNSVNIDEKELHSGYGKLTS